MIASVAPSTGNTLYVNEEEAYGHYFLATGDVVAGARYDLSYYGKKAMAGFVNVTLTAYNSTTEFNFNNNAISFDTGVPGATLDRGKYTVHLNIQSVTTDMVKHELTGIALPEGTLAIGISFYMQNDGNAMWLSDVYFGRSSHAAAVNLANNNGFEDGSSGWELSGTYDLDSDYAFEGVNGLMVGVNSPGIAKQYLDVGPNEVVQAGDVLKLTAMVKVLGNRRPLELRIVAVDEDGYRTTVSSPVTSQQWEQGELYYSVPEDALELELVFWMDGNGDGAYVDYVVMNKVDAMPVEEIEEIDPNWADDWTLDMIDRSPNDMAGGTISLSNDVFTVDESVYGNDLWTSADKLAYFSRKVSGNFSVTARIVSFDETEFLFQKVGILARDSLDNDSMYFFAGITMFGGGADTVSPYMSARLDTGVNAVGDMPVYPEDYGSGYVLYIRMDKYNNYYTAYYSVDGIEWMQWRNTRKINMGQNIYVGVTAAGAVTSDYVIDSWTYSTNVAPPTEDNLNYEALHRPEWNVDEAEIPVFPGAEGGGAVSYGGRGGDVYYVTNLNDSGAGSLREGLSGDTPRTVLFKAGGVITLNSPIQVGSYKTIAGQTAPGEGIALAANPDESNGGYQTPGALLNLSNSHDIVIRYLTLRHGVLDVTPRGLQGIPIGDTCLTINDAYNIAVDHVSCFWGNQNLIGIWSSGGGAPPTKNITISDSILAEAPYVNQSTGLLSGADDRVVNVDIFNNLFTANGHRNPTVKTKDARVINNIIANWGYYAAGVVNGTKADFIGNLLKPSARSSTDRLLWHDGSGGDVPGLTGGASVYVSGNKVEGMSEYDNDNWSMVSMPARYTKLPIPVHERIKRYSPLPNPAFPITVRNVDELDSYLLPIVGNSKQLNGDGTWSARRDSNDARIISNTVNNVSWYVEEDLSEFDFTLDNGTPYTDTDGDGMPDVWETEQELDPETADGNIVGSNGYTMLEHFLGGLVPDLED